MGVEVPDEDRVVLLVFIGVLDVLLAVEGGGVLVLRVVIGGGLLLGDGAVRVVRGAETVRAVLGGGTVRIVRGGGVLRVVRGGGEERDVRVLTVDDSVLGRLSVANNDEVSDRLSG